MTYEEFNEFCSTLPATNHAVQWGDSHVWKVGEKVFPIGGWQKSAVPAHIFKVSEIAHEVLRDMLGLRPAPYFASRGMKWIRLPDKARDNLFTQFLGSARAGGTGLGLVIVRDVMRAHRGDIALMETGEDGTIFCLQLPEKVREGARFCI